MLRGKQSLLRSYKRAVEQFNGREGKTRTLFRLPACAVFCPTSSQPLAKHIPYLVHKTFVLKIKVFDFRKLFQNFALFFG